MASPIRSMVPTSMAEPVAIAEDPVLPGIHAHQQQNAVPVLTDAQFMNP